MSSRPMCDTCGEYIGLMHQEADCGKKKKGKPENKTKVVRPTEDRIMGIHGW